MYFQKGKRKANSSIEVVDARSRRRTNVSLPVASCLETAEEAETWDETVQLHGVSHDDENEPCDTTDFDDLSEHDSDDESSKLPSGVTYKKRRERLSSNWEGKRLQLLRTSLAIEGFVPSKCSESTCSEAVKTRCKDCSFSKYYCKDCCDNIHRDQLHFHYCEIFEEGLWKQYNIPGQVLHNERHQCEGTHLKPITVVDLKGFHHEILFEYCTCFGVPESLLHCGIWPATPVEPNLGFTLDLMEMTLRLVMECHVSIHDMLKTLDFFKNPVVKKKKIYDQFVESFEEYRYHLKNRKAYDVDAEDVTCAVIECPACPKVTSHIY
ncbi:uncharacterized protein LOC114541035 [Dendronephthya gigantea]|uniref:uncharacterized protein LOC114541035 n=1 Tax=Dendronephthya gigantea TaxID=151771 RepID=UPI001068DB17|nr:uncharacterized protein LOC114541035 [Dendronephthya gigantea]